jgi:tubulin-specific chaperone A
MSLNPEKADARAAARDERKAKRGAAKESDEDKRLRIAVGVVRRLLKELEFTHKEIAKQGEKIEKCEADPGYDQSRLPQERAVLAESQQMVPEVKKKIAEAVAALAKLLSDEAFAAAVSAGLDEAKALVAELQ